MNFVDLWGWFHAFQRHAQSQNDGERLHLINLYHRAWKDRETDPDTALALLAEGRELAERLREPCMMLFFDYWRCDMYLYYARDIARGLDLSVRASVEAQKPMYHACPIRARVYLTLAIAYRMTDPLGYADQIAQTLDYLEKDVPIDRDTWRRIEWERAKLASVQNRPDDAERLTMSYIARSESDNFRLSSGYSMLCDLNYRRHQFQRALEYADLGEEAARKANQRLSAIDFLAWQALLQRKLNNEPEAKRLYRTVTANIQWLGAAPDRDYFYTLSQYHEAKLDYASALSLRQQQLEAALKGGSADAEVWARYEVCRLLIKLNRPVQQEMALARAAAQKLQNPKPMLTRLHALNSMTGCRLLFSPPRWLVMLINSDKGARR